MSDRGASEHRLVLTERDQRLLNHVARFRLINRDQAMVLAPFGSLTRANTRLASLVEARILNRKSLPIFPGKGSAQALYHLGPVATTALSSEAQRKQIRQITRWDFRQVTHVLAANHVLISLVAACREHPEAEFLDFRTEPDLRQLFVNRAVVPDGWFAWSEGHRRFNAFVEVDLHHEGLVAWRKKILGYQAYLESGRHQELLGYKAFRMLVLAKSRRRLMHLRTIAQVAGRLCLFGELDKVNAQNMFQAVWLRASGDQPIALREA